MRDARSAIVIAIAAAQAKTTEITRARVARCLRQRNGSTISIGQVYSFVATATAHAIDSGIGLSQTVLTIVTVTTAHAKESLLARTTRVCHVGSDTTTAPASIPAVPHHRSPIMAVPATITSAKKTEINRQARSSNKADLAGTMRPKIE